MESYHCILPGFDVGNGLNGANHLQFIQLGLIGLGVLIVSFGGIDEFDGIQSCLKRISIGRKIVVVEQLNQIFCVAYSFGNNELGISFGVVDIIRSSGIAGGLIGIKAASIAGSICTHISAHRFYGPGSRIYCKFDTISHVEYIFECSGPSKSPVIPRRIGYNAYSGINPGIPASVGGSKALQAGFFLQIVKIGIV
ncbi:MAG: hypothetical protein BWX77_00076 [Bacteroidetes bacterium ADurb.Bin090]|nr:MAG: hypothetical protein BWX77_00076 [Bacteroidetes bacterium ADurb.Bin090]